MLRDGFAVAEDGFQLAQVTLHGFPAWHDEGLVSGVAFVGVVLAHSVLPAKRGEADAKRSKPVCPSCSLRGCVTLAPAVQCRCVGLFSFELQAHLSEPFFRASLGFEQHIEVIAEDDEIIGVANDHDAMFPPVA